MQTYMSHFRMKLAAILVDSPLNTIKSTQRVAESSVHQLSDFDDTITLTQSEEIAIDLLSQPTLFNARETSMGICKYISSIDDKVALRLVNLRIKLCMYLVINV